MCALVLRNSAFTLCDCGTFKCFIVCHKFHKFKNGIASVFSSTLGKSKLNWQNKCVYLIILTSGAAAAN